MSVRSVIGIGRAIQLGMMLGVLAFAGLEHFAGLCTDDGSGGLFGFGCFVVKGGGLAVVGAVLGAIVGIALESRRGSLDD